MIRSRLVRVSGSLKLAFDESYRIRYSYDGMEVYLLRQAKREISEMPSEIVQDVFALIDELASGKHLMLPISRPLPSIARGLHELRLSGRAGEFRVFYVIRVAQAIYVIHAMQKKSQKIERRTVERLQSRIKGLLE